MNNFFKGCCAAAEALSICDCWFETHKTLVAVKARAISPMRYYLACFFWAATQILRQALWRSQVANNPTIA
jgi:hypothetical protein